MADEADKLDEQVVDEDNTGEAKGEPMVEEPARDGQEPLQRVAAKAEATVYKTGEKTGNAVRNSVPETRGVFLLETGRVGCFSGQVARLQAGPGWSIAWWRSEQGVVECERIHSCGGCTAEGTKHVEEVLEVRKGLGENCYRTPGRCYDGADGDGGYRS